MGIELNELLWQADNPASTIIMSAFTVFGILFVMYWVDKICEIYAAVLGIKK